MSKGLEALQEMRRYGAVMIPNCEIIEKELKLCYNENIIYNSEVSYES